MRAGENLASRSALLVERIQVEHRSDHISVRFRAMASDCELLLDTEDTQMAWRLGVVAEDEVRRIERKFSRYRKFNPVHCINQSAGQPIRVDEETARLLDYADLCFELSDGRFDITSGVLRHAWRFDGGQQLPNQGDIERLLERVGWQRVSWSRPNLRLPLDAEIDLGGVGKEYAADRAAIQVAEQAEIAFLINLGGDLVCSGQRRHHSPWQVGVEGYDTERSNGLSLQQGAVATSGDTRRYLEIEGKRYSHILDPKTGWPVEGAPALVTVAAKTCMEAGMMASLAMMMGPDAEAFLDAQQLPYWIQRRPKQ